MIARLTALPLAAKLSASVALAVILTLLTLWRVEAHRNDRLSDRMLKIQETLNTCRGSVNELTTSLEAQNRAVEALRDAGAARVAETRETLSSRDIERAVAQARAQWLRERPIVGETECERVFDVLDSARGRE
jgi:GTP cyclohydrolase III